MKLRKILASLLVAAALFSCVGVTATANTTSNTDMVAPQYLFDYNAWNELYITGTHADYTGGCIEVAGISKIQIDHTLEKFWGLFIWTQFGDTKTKYFTYNGRDKQIEFECFMNYLEVGTYRVRTDFTVTTDNGQVEKFTIYSNEAKVV